MDNISISNNRNQSIDLIKIVAMCLVVCLHTTHDYIVSGILNVEFVLYNSAVVAIPLFFMVSGYLLIGRDNVTFKYSIRKIYGILRFMLYIIGAWWIIYSIFNGFSAKTFIINYLGAFVQRGNFWMFWYFGAMCLIYCLFPLINQLFKYRKYYIAIFILISISQNLVFSWNLIGNGETNIIQSFRIWNWLAYFMLGGALKGVVLNKKYLYSLLLIVFIVNLIVIWRLSPYIGTSYCEYFYSCPIVILLSSNLFILIKEIKINNNMIIKMLSSLFLPVYTIHPFVIKFCTCEVLTKHGGLFYFVFVLSISVIISWALLRIPVIKKLFSI